MGRLPSFPKETKILDKNPDIETKIPDKDPNFVWLTNIKHYQKSLVCALSNLEKGISFFAQLDPHEATDGFNVAKGALQKFQTSVIETRGALDQLFQAADSMAILENPSPMPLHADRSPDSPKAVAIRLTSGFTACRNAIRGLLDHEPKVIKKEVANTFYGKKTLARLATLSTVFHHFEFGSPEEAMAAVKAMKTKKVTPAIALQEPKKLRTKQIDPEQATSLRALFEEKKALFGSELSYEMAQEICMQMQDCERGFPFEELRELFGLTNRKLKTELELLSLIVKPFNVQLTGSFETQGKQPIALEKDKQQAHPTRSIK